MGFFSKSSSGQGKKRGGPLLNEQSRKIRSSGGGELHESQRPLGDPGASKASIPSFFSQKNTLPKQKGGFWKSFFILSVVSGGVLWFALNYKNQRDSERVQIPQIVSDGMPFRLKPENPGGINIPGKDKLIYNPLGEREPISPEEILKDQLGQPPVPFSVVNDVHKEDANKISDLLNEIDSNLNQLENQVQKREEHNNAIKDKRNQFAEGAWEKTKNETSNATSDQKVVEHPEVSKKTGHVVSEITTHTTTAKPVEVAKEFSRNSVGDETVYVVQVGSFKSLQQAEKTWLDLEKKHGEILSKLSSQIVVATVNGEQYYRLYVRGVGKKQDADLLCQRLKERQVSCLVKKL